MRITTTSTAKLLLCWLIISCNRTSGLGEVDSTDPNIAKSTILHDHEDVIPTNTAATTVVVDADMSPPQQQELDVLPTVLTTATTTATSNQEEEGDVVSAVLVDEDDTKSNSTTSASLCDTNTANSSSNKNNLIVCIDGKPLPMENGIYVVHSIEAFQKYFHQHAGSTRSAADTDGTKQQPQQREVWLVLLYDDLCSYCPILLNRFEKANQLIQHHFQTSTDDIQLLRPPLFAKIKIPRTSSKKQNSTTTNVEENHISNTKNNNESEQQPSIDPEQWKRFGLTVVPKMFFITNDSYGYSFLLEYIGLKETPYDIYQMVLHFFYRLVLTTSSIQFKVDTVITYPLIVSNGEQVKQFVLNHSNFFLSTSDNTPLPLPTSMSMEERKYVLWILGEEEEPEREEEKDTHTMKDHLIEDSYNINPNDKRNIHQLDDFVILIQCRPDYQQQQQHHYTLRQHPNHNQEKSNDSNSNHHHHPLYEPFDRMAQVLSNRHDRLFVIITNCSSYNMTKGMVQVWKVPVYNNKKNNNNNMNRVWDDQTLSRCTFSTSTSSNEEYNINPSTTNANISHDDDDDENNNSNINKADQSSSTTTGNNTTSSKTTTKIQQNQLIDFMIQVCTPSLLWFDRQTTAPIAFRHTRKVHGTLFIDFHHIPNHKYATIYRKYKNKNNNKNTNNPPIEEDEDNNNNHKNENQQSDENWLVWDQYDEIYQQTKQIVQQFHEACRYHQQHSTCLDPTTIGMEQDIVCMIVPSTETRVLTTFDIDLWTPLDDDITSIGNNNSNSNSAQPASTILPILLITDQRSSGTKRYYLSKEELVLSSTSIQDFMNDFWQNKLIPTMKSSSRGARTTKSGIRILTAKTMEVELFLQQPNDKDSSSHDDDGSSSNSTSQQQQQRGKHSLIYFTSPTCGHCKRFSVIYNQLAEFIHYMGWDSILQLYQMDISTNEIVGSSSFLSNITIRWVPDLYYLGPNDHDDDDDDYSPDTPTTPIIRRFDQIDEMGDDVGRITYPSEIIEWFLEIGSLKDHELQQLLNDLQHKFE